MLTQNVFPLSHGKIKLPSYLVLFGWFFCFQGQGGMELLLLKKLTQKHVDL